MKTRLLTTLLCTILFFSFETKAQIDSNWDLEQWLYGHPVHWTSMDFLDISQTTDKISGDYAAKMQDATGDARSQFTSTTTLRPGQQPTYVVCHFKFGNYSPLDAARIRVFLIDENGNQKAVVNQKIQTHVTDYTPLTMSFEPMAYYFIPEPKKIKIEIVFDSNVSQPGEFYVDDFIFEGMVTGINSVEKGMFNLYPNPTNGVFKIDAQNITVDKIEITDMAGKQVYAASNNQMQNISEINLSDFSKGIYYVKCYNEQKVYTEKLIIQ